MGTYELFQTGPLTGPSHRVAYGSAADGLAGNISWKHPFSRTHLPPIASQQFQQLRGQLDIAALMAFAQFDADHHPLSVDVGGAQMHRLADTHASAVHGAEDDVMRKRRSRLQQLQNLLGAEN